MKIKLTVKEVAGVGSTHPVQVTIPFKVGEFQTLEKFNVEDSMGNLIPASFSVLERYWSKDDSIRHMIVYFQPIVGAFPNINNGISEYFLSDRGQDVAIVNPIKVSESSGMLSVSNNKLKIDINKEDFSIMTNAGPITSEFGFYNRATKKIEKQVSFDRDDIKCFVEISTPMYSVIKISAPTKYTSESKHIHGWAIRLYVYADREFFKLDYQLQNSDSQVQRSNPLYFDYHNVILDSKVTSIDRHVKSVIVKNASELEVLGSVYNSKAVGIIRNFNQMWHNGLEQTTSGKIIFELWPSWGQTASSNRDLNSFGGRGNENTLEDLYQLDDMQHVYKEVLISTRALSENGTLELAKTFQYPPVVTLDSKIYQDTKATLSFGGYLPTDNIPNTGSEDRKPDYTTFNRNSYNIARSDQYAFGWDAFGGDVLRRYSVNMAGGDAWEYNQFFISGSPSDYYRDLDFAIADLNMRPIWMSNYTYEKDSERLKLSSNPYGGRSLRNFTGAPGDNDKIDTNFLPGRARRASPRDEPHSWYYHVLPYYVLSGNLWMKDWYEFMGQFKRTFINGKDPYPEKSSRAHGHCINDVINSYRVTGDIELLDDLKNIIVTKILNDRDPITKVRFSGNWSGVRKETPFQIAYLSVGLINLRYELDDSDPFKDDILDIITGFVDWLYNNSNYCGYLEYNNPELVSYSAHNALRAVEIALWVAMELGEPKYLEHAQAYMEHGLGGGTRPYLNQLVQFKEWEGGPLGRIYTSYLQGIYPEVTGTSKYIPDSTSSDNNPTFIKFDDISSGVINSSEINESLVITGFSNARNGTKVVVSLNNRFYNTVVYDGKWSLYKDKWVTGIKSKDLKLLVDGENYKLEASIVTNMDNSTTSVSTNILVNLTDSPEVVVPEVIVPEVVVPEVIVPEVVVPEVIVPEVIVDTLSSNELISNLIENISKIHDQFDIGDLNKIIRLLEKLKT